MKIILALLSKEESERHSQARKKNKVNDKKSCILLKEIGRRRRRIFFSSELRATWNGESEENRNCNHCEPSTYKERNKFESEWDKRTKEKQSKTCLKSWRSTFIWDFCFLFSVPLFLFVARCRPLSFVVVHLKLYFSYALVWTNPSTECCSMFRLFSLVSGTTTNQQQQQQEQHR